TVVASPSMLSQLSPEQIFDAVAINIDGPRAWDLDLALDLGFADTGTNYRLTLRNGVLVYRRVPADPATAGVTLTLADKNRLLTLVAGDGDSDGLRVDGDPAVLASLIAVLDRPDPGFNIITP
ncbi:MAG TPA: alkyl sulfatase C-terminal domain-containing protein, partial [Mycobacterium sp.]|nr:alkyl sulfatase C-terminal domain-containing protein [Mycobacterium sp.]